MSEIEVGRDLKRNIFDHLLSEIVSYNEIVKKTHDI